MLTQSTLIDNDISYQPRRNAQLTEIDGFRESLDKFATDVAPITIPSGNRDLSEKRLIKTTSKATTAQTINGTVYAITEHFITVHALLAAGGIRVNIPIELCPDDVVFDGMPVAISIDRSSGYSGLKVEKREKKNQSNSAIEKEINSVLEWADNL